MGFFDALLRIFGDDQPARPHHDRERVRRALLGDEPAVDGTEVDPEEMAAPPHASEYDRRIWRKKLRLMLTEKMPLGESEYHDFLADAHALGFGRDWIETAQREEFHDLIRVAVSDGVLTLEERRNLDLARRLIGLSDAEAEEALHTYAAQAAATLGHPVEGA